MNAFSVYPDRRETSWAIRYLLFEVAILPRLLTAANILLGSPVSVTWLNVIVFSINALAVLIIFRRFLKHTLRHVPAQAGRTLGAVLLGLALYWGLMFALSLVFLALAPDFVNINDSNIVGMVSQDFVPMVISTIVLVPVAEELLFRGALFGGFYPHHPKAAYVLSILGFSFVHVTTYIGFYPWHTLLLCFLQYIPAGFCLAWAYRHSGSILSPIIMHSVINAVGMLAMR